jgi:hypothetical protein
MKTIRTVQFLSMAALMTALNASASMTYDTAFETAGGKQSTGVPAAFAGSNAVSTPDNSSFGVVRLTDTNSATTAGGLVSKPTFVPEPSTIIAGALLLLPLAAGIVRTVRRVRTV